MNTIKDNKPGNALATEQLKQNIVSKLRLHFGRSMEEAGKEQVYHAVALCLREEIVDLWSTPANAGGEKEQKQLYYLSAEYLIGRALVNNLINMGRYHDYEQALQQLGYDLADIEECENDAALGNGGLGRLAACFLDSLSTANLPVIGCGIRYEYGLFRQRILEGRQVELPDDWIESGGVWEIERSDERYEVRFGGWVEELWEEQGMQVKYHDHQSVYAVPYDMPIVGYQTQRPATLRLWSARAVNRLDLDSFNRGDYRHALQEQELAEVITKVLYPENSHEQGRQLRLKQFYFLASASMQYLLARHKKLHGDVRSLPEYAVVQINDTHPALSTVELLRLLLDEEGLSWDEACDIVTRCFNYTNHTIMAEALESWPEQMFAQLLPRIHRLIISINERFLLQVAQRFPHDNEKLQRMAIVHDGMISMPNLCLALTAHVNGVSQLHGDIIKRQTFRDFYLLQPDKFLAITNGITPRRWLAKANPALTQLIIECIGDGFLADWSQLAQLKDFVGDSSFIERFAAIKQDNKQRFAEHIYRRQGVLTDTQAIFDVQAKRLHEYKRQLLKLLHILHLYDRVKAGEQVSPVPLCFIFAAKAPPGYTKAKKIIRLINAVARLIDSEPRCKGQLQLLFVENYNVSAAELLIPAADISEQISTAGHEASGTGNMKFMLSGAVTIGTWDGANIEMAQQLGADNIYIFGARTEQLAPLEAEGSYRPGQIYEQNPSLRRALEHLIDGSLSDCSAGEFSDIYHSLLFGQNFEPADRYYLLLDFAPYQRIYMQVMDDYVDRSRWQQRAAMNTACAGYFSSDRTIAEYNSLIWQLQSVCP